MTVEALSRLDFLSPAVLSEPNREISGVYVGDLLSWVMGRASSGQVWITIMSNINILAVASLADTSCVITAEGVTLDSEVLDTARERKINLLYSSLPIYETALRLGGVL